MSSQNLPDRSEGSTAGTTESRPFELKYKAVDDVHPLDLIGNAYLALHHHMAPADGGFDLGADEDD
jgi:hypothetical protein